MLENEITRENLRKMVIRFYTKILKDDIVGSFFIKNLGDDLTSKTWGEHLDLLTNFWASIYLEEASYRGNPLAPHLLLKGLQRVTFERWLKLFFEVLDSTYEVAVANQLKDRSTIIAGNFMRNLAL